MEDEIFGPILPVLPYAPIGDAIAFVNDRPKPLALYVFANRDAAAERVIDHTSAGGVTVNHTLLHLAVTELPFGGVGHSGFGAYHGQTGFNASRTPNRCSTSAPSPTLDRLPALRRTQAAHPEETSVTEFRQITGRAHCGASGSPRQYCRRRSASAPAAIGASGGSDTHQRGGDVAEIGQAPRGHVVGRVDSPYPSANAGYTAGSPPHRSASVSSIA